jgi:hypothetical protein
MVACPACHTPTPFSGDFSRRKVGLVYEDASFNVTTVVQAWYNYSSAATRKILRSKVFNNTDGQEMGDSNICIACHSGTAGGNVIKQNVSNNLINCANQTALPSIVCRLSGGSTVTSGLTHSFWSTVDFIDPHGFAAANILLPDNLRAGYEYRLSTTTTPYHANNIGTGTTGPCVGCHMSSPKKHVFSPISSSASTGAITAITTTLCSSCHPGIDAGFLETEKKGYQAALTVITAQLEARGVYFNATKSPYFFTTSAYSTPVTDWNTPAPPVPITGYPITAPGSPGQKQGANLFGAAFNLRLMEADSGWVHNPNSTKRLLYDTIDYLDDGNPYNNTVSSAITNAAVASTVKTDASNYLIPRPL